MERPARPWHFTGTVFPSTQLERSRLWTSDWGTSSPDSQRKWYCGAALPIQLAVLRFALGNAIGRAQEILFDAHHVADSAVVNALHGFDIARLEAALQAGDDAELLFLRQIAGLLHELEPARVDAVGLLHKHMLAGLKGRHGMEGMKLGCVGNQHHVRRLDHMLVSVETGKAMGIVHNHLRAFGVLQRFTLVVDAVAEHVAHSHQPRAGVGSERLKGGAAVAVAAADHADLDDIAAGGVGAAAKVERADGCGGGGDRRGLQEITAGEGMKGKGLVFHNIRSLVFRCERARCSADGRTCKAL